METMGMATGIVSTWRDFASRLHEESGQSAHLLWLNCSICQRFALNRSRQGFSIRKYVA